METTVLEDNLEYIILDTIMVNGNNYVYLINKDLKDRNIQDICIRKIVDEGKNLIGLDSEEEFQKSLVSFLNKNKNMLNAQLDTKLSYVYTNKKRRTRGVYKIIFLREFVVGENK